MKQNKAFPSVWTTKIKYLKTVEQWKQEGIYIWLFWIYMLSSTILTYANLPNHFQAKSWANALYPWAPNVRDISHYRNHFFGDIPLCVIILQRDPDEVLLQGHGRHRDRALTGPTSKIIQDLYVVFSSISTYRLLKCQLTFPSYT